jgi:hypothetical protein
MSAALKHAVKVSEDVRILLSARSESTVAMVKRWFCDESCGETELNDAFQKLSAGFLKIAVACSSNRIVLPIILTFVQKETSRSPLQIMVGRAADSR